GKATLADLTAGNATHISPSASCSPAFPGSFPDDGNWTAPLYAVSIPGVRPTACATWFQAAQACRLSGKRLPTTLEWPDGAAGTPDNAADFLNECNTATGNNFADAVNTGSRANCKSSWGAFDLIGNVNEWVAEWVPLSTTACPGWDGFSNDYQCFAGVDA